MGYQESWLYIEPQRHFNKLIRAYEQAEQEGYYKVAGVEPRSVVAMNWTCDENIIFISSINIF